MHFPKVPYNITTSYSALRLSYRQLYHARLDGFDVHFDGPNPTHKLTIDGESKCKTQDAEIKSKRTRGLKGEKLPATVERKSMSKTC